MFNNVFRYGVRIVIVVAYLASASRRNIIRQREINLVRKDRAINPILTEELIFSNGVKEKRRLECKAVNFM